MADEMTVMDLYEKHCDRIKSTGSSQYSSLCPFPDHSDRKPSFSFNTLSTKYYCFGCPAKGNAITFAQFFGEDPTPFYSDDYKSNRTLINNGKTTVKNKTVTPKLDLTDEAEEYHENLGVNYDDEYHAQRVGHHKGVLVFPYFDKDGNVDGFKFHKPGFRTEGNMKKRWYLEWMIEYYPRDEFLIIAEGEKDALSLLHKGYYAVSSSGGALTVPDILKVFKEFKGIIIGYDNDKAGRDGAPPMAQAIYDELGIICLIAKWRDGLPDKYDISDDKDGKEFALALDQGYEFRPNPTKDEPQRGVMEVMSIGQLVNADFQEPEIIIHNMLQQESISVLGGCSGTGKSWASLQIGMCIASGLPVFDYFEVSKPHKVLLCQFELTNGQMLKRATMLKKSFEKEWDMIDQNFDYQVMSKKIAFTDRWWTIDRFLSDSDGRYSGGVIIVDNLYTSVDEGIDTSNNAQLIPVVKIMGDICETYKIAMLIISHHKKGTKLNPIDIDDILGGAALTRNSSNVFQMKQSKLSTDLRVAMITKVRGEASELIEEPFKLKFNPDTGLFKKAEIITNELLHYIEPKERWEITLAVEMKDYESGRGTDVWSRSDIWDFLSTKEGWEQTPSNESKVTRFINKCVEWGLIKKDAHNTYRIVKVELSEG